MKYPVLLTLVAVMVFAQEPAPLPGTGTDVMELSETPVFRAEVVSKTTQAINYRFRSGSTRIDFAGTALMPRASGEASVANKRGRTQISVSFENVGMATQFGSEYLTYVLWAITPEGRPVNLGEVVLNNGRSRMTVTTDLQVFGLVVTAEPYFAVSQPSDLIVLQNEAREDTKGRMHIVEAQYELLKRGQYEKLANPLNLSVDLKNVPLELYEARNALQIATSVGAEKWAGDIFTKAQGGLDLAENAHKRGEKKVVSQLARQAVQSAEDARVVTLERIEQARIEREQREAAERARLASEAAERAEAERQAEAQRRAQAEASRVAAETERIAAERRRMEAELEAARAAARKAEAEAARAQALLEQQRAMEAADAARQDADLAQQAARQAEQEKLELRQRLLDMFNQVLETRDTPRGLVVNMSDVLFDVGKFNLRPVAREKLARLSGILASYPDLQLECEGHTDSTGALEFNNRLSLQRAEAVRDYLVEMGVSSDRVSAIGMGPSMPVAPNETREGRQQNRRVEIIVSGEVIGTTIG